MLRRKLSTAMHGMKDLMQKIKHHQEVGQGVCKPFHGVAGKLEISKVRRPAVITQGKIMEYS